MKAYVAKCPECNSKIFFNYQEDKYQWTCGCFIGRPEEAKDFLEMKGERENE